MRMHSRPATHKGPARASAGSLITAALPFLLAATGMILVGIALILELGLLVLAGAGIVVIAASMYFIAASLDRADRRSADARTPYGSDSGRARAELPRRGPLADAAVDALTRTDGPGGVWPPLSSKNAQSASHPQETRKRTAPEGVTMWDPHGRVAPESFQQHPGQSASGSEARPPAPQTRAYADREAQEALMEFQPAPTPDRSPGPESSDPAPSASSRAAWDPEAHSAPERDLRLWPGACDLGSWGHLSRDSHEQRMSEQRRAASMKERRDRLAQRLPTVGAILATPKKDEPPPKSGASRGKCSSCQNYLWAPPQRPITLKCPSCGHKARLY